MSSRAMKRWCQFWPLSKGLNQTVRRRSWIWAWLSVLSHLLGGLSAEAGGFGGKHVLVVGIDGLRSDALQVASAPTLRGLAATGAVTWDAYAGGILDTPTQQRTVSGPGWASIVSGVWIDRHQVSDNSFFGYQSASYPHFFRRILEHNTNAFLSSIVEWSPVDESLVAPVGKGVKFRQTAMDGDTRDLTAKTIAHLKTADPDVLFLHFDTVDLTGHRTGFSPVNPVYLAAIADVDKAVSEILAAIKARPNATEEKWMVVVVTDHGGVGLSHGNQTLEERTIPLIVNGPGIVPQIVSPGPGHTAVPPTVLGYLGVPVSSDWGWADAAFGLNQGPILPPRIVSHPLDRTVTEGMPARFTAAASGSSLQLQWLREGLRLSRATNTSLQLNAVQRSDAGRYALEVTNPAGSITSNPAILTVVPRRYYSFTNGLVVHLPMDGDYKDISGNTNHGIARGKVGFGPGRVGSGSMRFTTKKDGSELSYVTLGSRIMRSLASNDFSVAFWINVTNSTEDPAWVSNKDWNSGGNTGFVIAGQPGSSYKHNFRGAAGSRVDASGGNVGDGLWHHIVLCCERRGDARLYQDGQLVSVVALTTSPGSVDSKLPLNLGQDGTGSYTYGATVGILNAYLDDFGMWSRALPQEEVEALYLEGTEGITFGILPRISLSVAGDQLVLEWTGPGPGFVLESAATLDPSAVWTEVIGAASGVRIPVEAQGARFYRLRGPW